MGVYETPITDRKMISGLSSGNNYISPPDLNLQITVGPKIEVDLLRQKYLSDVKLSEKYLSIL